MTAGGKVSVKTISELYAAALYNANGGQVYTAYHPKTVLRGQDTRMSFTDIRNVNTYWRSLEVEYILPTNDKGVQATYVGEYQNDPNAQQIDSTDPTKVIYKWKDATLSNTVYLRPILHFPDTFQDGDVATFYVKFTGTTYTGSVIKREGTLTTKVVDEKPILSLYTDKRAVYTGDQSSYPAGTVEQLGNLSIQNTGYTASGRLRMLYEFGIDTNSEDFAAKEGERNLIDVSYILLPVVAGQSATVTCTLVDAKNSNAFTYTMEAGVSSANTNGVSLAASQVAKAAGKADGEWYFKSISYEIESIPANTQLFKENAIRTYSYAGNFYGRFNKDVASRLTVYSIENGTEKQILHQMVNSNKTLSNTKPLHIASVSINGNTADTSETVTAGNDVTLDVSLGMHAYPYGSSQWAQNPILYFLAPVGVTLNSSGVSASAFPRLWE